MERKITYSFERYEIKYLVTDKQRRELCGLLDSFMSPDEFGKSSIRNVYFDTPDRRLILNSLDSPVFKEKLRLRSYGAALPDDIVFIELKRKCDNIVYKRRVAMTENDALDYLFGGEPHEDTQVTREISSFLDFYGNIEPAVFISCDREAFFSKDDRDFRVTFDENILWREHDMSLCKGVGGEPLLRPGTALMEIKTSGAIPLWLTDFLTDNALFKTSFSKYGLAFTASYNKKRNGSVLSA